MAMPLVPQERAEKAEARVKELEAEVEHLRTFGVAGVMHEVDQAFYDLTVKQRDHAWLESKQLAKDVLSFEDQVAMPLSETDERIVRAKRHLEKY